MTENSSQICKNVVVTTWIVQILFVRGQLQDCWVNHVIEENLTNLSRQE